MNNQNIDSSRQLVRVVLSSEQYLAIMNTKCQGAVMLVDLGFKPFMRKDGFIGFVANCKQSDAEDIIDWADFCCP